MAHFRTRASGDITGETARYFSAVLATLLLLLGFIVADMIHAGLEGAAYATTADESSKGISVDALLQVF
jgi:hypothetical protein